MDAYGYLWTIYETVGIQVINIGEPQMTEVMQQWSNGEKAYVLKEVRGKHHDHCLCNTCDKLVAGDKEKNCPIAQSIFENCEKHNVLTPVYQCPDYVVQMNVEKPNLPHVLHPKIIYIDFRTKEEIEFCYIGATGMAIVCEPGDSGGGMQSSWAIPVDRVSYPPKGYEYKSRNG